MSSRIYLTRDQVKAKKLARSKLPIHDFAPAVSLPVTVDYRNRLPPAYDQGDLGSCTANALSGNLQFYGFTDPSRLFCYYSELTAEDVNGKPLADTGADVYDGVLSLEKIGICEEKYWPYIISKFTQKPPQNAYTNALLHKNYSGKRVPNTGANFITNLKTIIAQGSVLLAGIAVYSSFESDQVAKTGNVPIPSSNEECLGGHEVLIVGYMDSNKSFIVRNSWGSSWGLNGYFYLPYAYVNNSNLCDEIVLISHNPTPNNPSPINPAPINPAPINPAPINPTPNNPVDTTPVNSDTESESDSDSEFNLEI